MDANISKQLDEIVNQTIFYKGETFKILKWKLVAGNYCIVTDAKTLQFYPSEIQFQFLDKLEDEQAIEVIKKFPAPKEKVTAVILIPEENKTIKETLLETLKKVKEDSSYLPQAKAICEVTNAMVNVQKTEIEIIKLQDKI